MKQVTITIQYDDFRDLYRLLNHIRLESRVKLVTFESVDGVKKKKIEIGETKGKVSEAELTAKLTDKI